MKENKKAVFKQLFLINLIYAYPQVADQVRIKNAKKKGEKGRRSVTGVVMRNYVMAMLTMIVIYGFFFSLANLTQVPLLIDIMIGMFIVMSILQNFTYFFNVFYESKDAESYMPLPIRESQVFTAKLAVVAFTTMQLVVPVFLLIWLYLWQMGKGAIYATIFGLIDFLGIFVIVVILNLALMLLLAKTSIFSRFRKKIVAVFMILSIVMNIVIIVSLQTVMRQEAINIFALGSKSEFIISGLAVNVKGQIVLVAAMIAICIAGGWLVARTGIRNLYSNIRKLQSADDGIRSEKMKKMKKNSTGDSLKKSSLGKVFFKFNLNNMKDSTLIAQILLPVFMPLIMLIPNMSQFADPIVSYFIKGNQLIIMLGMSVLMSALGNGGNNIAAIIVSLDGEVYNYVKSLPLNRRLYVRYKILIAALIQAVPAAIMIAGIGIYLDFDISSVLIGTANTLLLGTALAALWVIYDYNHVMPNWSNITQLITKVGRWIPPMVIFLTMFGFGFMMGAVMGADFNSVFAIGIISVLSITIMGLSIIKVNRFMKRL